jgi:hypothetical protein
MSLADIDRRIKKSGEPVKNFKSMTNYCIILENGGCIHVAGNGETYVSAGEERTKELNKILGIE